MGIGKNLRALRERLGYTQKTLAEKIGITSAAIGNYERDVSHPREDILYKLFEVLNCEPNDLFGGLYKSTASNDERLHSEKYRELDEEGRNRVDICTEQELSRCLQGAHKDTALKIDAGEAQ